MLTLPPTAAANGATPEDRVRLLDSIPFWLVHVACLMVFWTGVSWAAMLACVVTYVVRAFGITGGYHRYLGHRTFKTTRTGQFVLTVLSWVGLVWDLRAPPPAIYAEATQTRALTAAGSVPASRPRRARSLPAPGAGG